jgi:hypothetical protein
MVVNNLMSMADSTFCLADKTKYTKLEESSVLRRYTHFTSPAEGGTGPFKDGSRIIFNFDTRGFIDLTTLRFEAQLFVKLSELEPVDTLRFKFKTCFGSCIKNLQVKAGGITIVDIPSYNIWLAFSVNITTPRTHMMTQKSLLEGYIDFECRRTKFGGTQPTYTSNEPIDFPYQTPFFNELENEQAAPRSKTEAHKFDAGIFSVLKYMPAHLIQRLQLIIDLAAPNDFIMTYGRIASPAQTLASPAETVGYQLVNPRIYYDIVEMDKVFEDSVRLIASENALYIPFLQISRHAYTQPINTQDKEQTVVLTEKVGSLKGIYLLCFNQRWDNKNNIAAANEHFGFLDDDKPVSDELSFLQFKIAGQLHPTYSITNITEVAAQYFLAMGNYNDNRGQCGVNTAMAGLDLFFYRGGESTNNYVVGGVGAKFRQLSVLAYDFDREECPELVTGYNTIGPQSDILIRYVAGGKGTTIDEERTLHIWTLFNSTLRVLGNGKVEVLR